ncbi:hypothetical protein [Aquimarina longa]|uniref:hypothetical protein n=1 Tax=Aquimarina longa TaxID=1080221 RepID=UPI0007819AE5|nr:hypothetical protein [Aquimarina longa]
MAAATTIVAGSLMAGGGLAKAFSGGAQARKYKNMIHNYDRQDLTNLAQNIQLSTYGSDLIKNETALNTATIMNGVQQAGSRAIIGATGKIAGMGIEANQKAVLDLDKQQQKRQYAMYEEGARIRNMQEQRENSDLAGMGAMYEAGRQTMWGGIGDVAQAGMYGMRQLDSNK